MPWSLQDAKNQFSRVVDAAVAGEPQMVTRRGKPAVVVVSAEKFERMKEAEKAGAPSFVDFLLSMPQDDVEFERIPVEPRTIDFSDDKTD